ncbi:MAG: polymer-forming cytoskeletal protein [Nannocystaceae bacterium]|nr:polymer-forming cytoskeletal protein [Nannocystaceae bacterium]
MPNVTNFITEDTTIRGSVTTASSLTVAGAIEGDINAGGEVSILEDALVTGDISGPNITIAGKVEGRITASGRLVIGAVGAVQGDISVRSLLIEEGGTLEGQCKMGTGGSKPKPKLSGPADSIQAPLAPPLRAPE